LSLVAQKQSGDVVLVSFDPAAESIVQIEIPGSTEAQVASGLGTWRLSSVTKLGKQENLKGAILAETIVKTFQIPVEAWGEEGVLGFASPNSLDVLRATFANYQTNLSFWDKVNLAFFGMSIKRGDRTSLNLVDTGYIYKTNLVDGEGYQKRQKIPATVTSIFADSAIAEEALQVAVINASGNPALSQGVAATIEVMGAKVVSVKNLPAAEEDCRVAGSSSLTKREIAVIFSCTEKSGDSLAGDFDIEVFLGSAFGARF